MPLQHDPLKNEISACVQKSISELVSANGLNFSLSAEQLYASMMIPPQFELGQIALPCFPFAKSMRLPPPRIADELAKRINENLPSAKQSAILKVTSVNGYLNFHANFCNLGNTITNDIRTESTFKNKLLLPTELEKIVVEYSQPNTLKSLHVGHLRCLVLGDAVCNLLSYIGHNVVRATYPGDIGAHIAKSLWYIQHKLDGKIPETDRAQWLGQIYALAGEALKLDNGTPQETENRTVLSGILKSIQKREGEYHELWKQTREWSIADMHRTYDWLNCKFDIWYFESQCDEPARALVKQKLKEGFFIVNEGATGLDLSEYKLGFALLLKTDGNGLYLTNDLELMRKKFEDPTVTQSIVVVDSRQKLHFQQLFKVGELMGYPQAARSVHLAYETVNTADGKAFSSRELNGLKLDHLRFEMEQKVTQNYLERYRGEWTDAQIEETARIVTIGALKYGMLKVDNGTQVTFVLEEWLRLDGDTGPYLQYVHARCRNILEKVGAAPALGTFQFEAVEKQEQELLHLLGRFNEFAILSATQLRPSVIAGYIYDVAKSFNRFYEACNIRSSEGNLKLSRLSIVESTAEVMRRGLALLGIPAPQRM